MTPRLIGGITEEEVLANGDTATSTDIIPWLFPSHLAEYLNSMIASRDPHFRVLDLLNAFRSQRGMSALPTDTALELYSTALVHVRVNVLGRGSPADLAIIYSPSIEEREAWLLAHGKTGSSMSHLTTDVPELSDVLPDSKRTIGYVVSGNFSLARGSGHALGSITLKSYVELLRQAANGSEKARHLALVKVRNKDSKTCRLASISPV